MSYAGDSIRKKYARGMCYLSAATRVQRLGNATVVALAGDEGADASIVRALRITTNPQKMLIVDIEKKGLDAARLRWPGIQTFHGWLHEAPLPNVVDLAVLDFCGSLDNHGVRAGISAFRGKLHPGAVVMVTICYGRDAKSDAMKWAAAREEEHGKKARIIGRMEWAHEIISGLLGIKTVNYLKSHWRKGMKESTPLTHMVDFKHYTGHRMPMLAMVIQVGRWGMFHRRAVTTNCRFGDAKTAGKSQILSLARTAEETGVSAADLLNVSAGTIAAWKAHETRGTYRHRPAVCGDCRKNTLGDRVRVTIPT